MPIYTNSQVAGSVPPTFLNVNTNGQQTMVNNQIIFNVTNDLLLFVLMSECQTGNDTTNSTLQYSVTNALGNGAFSGVSSSLASESPGATILLQPGALSNPPIITTGNGLGGVPWSGIRISGGSNIILTIAGGSTTGTWRHYAVYQPLESGAFIIPAF